jgi:hypothetical protein
MILSIGNDSGNDSGNAIECDMPLILSIGNGSGNGSGAIGCDMPLILSVDRTRAVLPMVVVAKCQTAVENQATCRR